MQMVGPLGRYLPQWLRAPGNGSGPAICQHTHTHLTLPNTMSVLETPFDIHVSSVYQTHTCMQAPIPTLCISAKKTHNKGSRTRPIMSTLMPRSGIPVICSRATLSCDSSYFVLGHQTGKNSVESATRCLQRVTGYTQRIFISVIQWHTNLNIHSQNISSSLKTWLMASKRCCPQRCSVRNAN